MIEIAALRPGDGVLEIGAGTGEIGQWLARTSRYVGLDIAQRMLEVFRSKLTPPNDDVLLVQCDANGPWPVRDGSVVAALASRVAHLLDADNLIAELSRVCTSDGFFLIGRVNRDPDSVKSRLRHQRESLLRERGLSPGAGAAAAECLVDGMVSAGASRLDPRLVATWTASTSPDQVLSDWKAITTMGGIDVDLATRLSILTELRGWAGAEYGNLAEPIPHDEHYTLTGVRLGGGASSPGSSEDAWTTQS